MASASPFRRIVRRNAAARFRPACNAGQARWFTGHAPWAWAGESAWVEKVTGRVAGHPVDAVLAVAVPPVDAVLAVAVPPAGAVLAVAVPPAGAVRVVAGGPAGSR